MEISVRHLDLWERWLCLENTASYSSKKGWTPQINLDTSLNNRFAGNAAGDGRPEDQPWVVNYLSRYARNLARIDIICALEDTSGGVNPEVEQITEYTRQLGKAANNLYIMGYINELILSGAAINDWQAAARLHVFRMAHLLDGFELEATEEYADSVFPGFSAVEVGIEQAMVNGLAQYAFEQIEQVFPSRNYTDYIAVADPLCILTHAYFIRQSENYGWPKPGVLSSEPAELWNAT